MEVRKNKILLVRLGPVNAQRQRGDIGHQPAVSRGMWAFPFPHQDPFFYFHRWTARLPKRLQREAIASVEDDDERVKLWAEHEAAIREIRKRERISKFWHEGPFYSHIAPKGMGGNDWYLWTSPKEWAKAASKTLWQWMRWGDGPLVKMNSSADHLELFIPMVAQPLPATVPFRKRPEISPE